MLISQENLEIRGRIIGFEKRTDEMHMGFYKYYHGEEQRMPDWQRLEQDLINYSRKKIYDLELSKNLDRVLYKFQNRKKIWLKWADELQHSSKKESEDTESAEAEEGA